MAERPSITSTLQDAELGKRVREQELLNTRAPADQVKMNEMGRALEGLAAQNAGLQNMFLANRLGTNPNAAANFYWNEEIAPGITRKALADAEYEDQRQKAVASIMPEVRDLEQEKLLNQNLKNADQIPVGLAKTVTAGVRG